MKPVLISITALLVLVLGTTTVNAQPYMWMQTAVTSSFDQQQLFQTNIWQGEFDDDSLLEPADFERKDLRISKEDQFERFALRGILFFLGFLGAVMLFVMVLGGYWMLTSRGNEEQYTKGKQILTNVIIGFIVIITSYALIVELLSSTSILRTIFSIFG